MESYYQEHRDEIKEYQRKYYQKHKDERKKYYQEHRDEIVNYQKKYRQEHKNKNAEYQREYYQRHKDEIKEYQREYRDEIKEYQRNRKLERPYKKLGDFLTRRLKELNKNQSWLAEQIGVSRGSTSRYSAGVCCPRDKLRRRLCKILEIDISDLEKIVENQNGKRN